MKYDDSETYVLNFETGLDSAAANTHIGMYLAWAVLSGLGRDDDASGNWAREAARLQARAITGGQFLSRLCDGKLTAAAFNAEGNAFAAAYYGKDFHHDYARVFSGQMPSTGHEADDLCSVPDTWANFELLQPLLDARLAHWRAAQAVQPGVPPALAALHRRAEDGDGHAAFMLARAYRRSHDIPADWVAADAMLLLARERGVPEAADYPQVLPGSEEPAALAAQLRQPGQLTVVLAERHGQRVKAAAQAAAQAAADAPAEAPAAAVKPSAPAWVALALGLGAANLLAPLLLVSLDDRPALALKVALAVIGAAGVFAAAPSRGLRGVVRLLLTALTAVLGSLGGLLCLWLLLRKPADDAAR